VIRELPVLVVGQGQDAAADRDPRFVAVAGRLPRFPEHRDLLGLELVKGHTGVLRQQR
jgi:hypothetical protein